MEVTSDGRDKAFWVLDLRILFNSIYWVPRCFGQS